MPKEYTISKGMKRRLIIGIILEIFLGIYLVAKGIYWINDRDVVPRILTLFAGAGYLLLPWFMVDVIKTTRIVITPEHLTFYSPGLEMITSWDNLERIGSMPVFFNLVRYDSLVLRQPAEQKTAWLFTRLKKKPEHEIPLGLFSHWRTSEMGQEIRKYAPHLFSNGGGSK